MNVVDGKIEGPFVQQDEAGRPMIQANFKNGLIEGPMQIRDERGRLRYKINFQGGRLHGPAIIIDPDKPATAIQFRDGEVEDHPLDDAAASTPISRGWLRRLIDRWLP